MRNQPSGRNSTTLRSVATLAMVFSLVALWSGSLHAQQIAEGPRVQVFAGYSGVRFDSKSFGFSNNTNLNGWTGSAAYNLIPEFGIVGQIGGHYGPNIRVVEWMVGPQGRYSHWRMDFFGHLLFGKAQTRVSTNVLQTDNNRAWSVGGGFDFPISDHFSIRVFEADYFKTHSIGEDQSNLKYSTGLVFRWGTVKRHKPPKLATP